MMRNRAIRAAGAITAAFSAFMAFGWSFFAMVVRCKQDKRLVKKKWYELPHAKINHPRHKFKKEYEDGIAWCQRQPMRDCYIKSRDGLELHASYLPAQDPERIVLLAHGYRSSRFGNFAYIAKFLHENHCSLLFVDQRCCGGSEGEYITFGAKEQYDIQRWAQYIARRNKSRLPIYLYGQSLGAASVLMASGHSLPKEIKGIIADCGFRSMEGQIKDMAANWFHLRWIGLLLFRLDLFCKLFAGFRMRDADTAEALRTNRRPVLFFHGAKDTYVDPKNSRENFARCQAPKELVVISGARHLCSAYVAPELYQEKMREFFEKYDNSSTKDYRSRRQ